MNPRHDPQFRILVLGDFSGRASRGEHAPGELTKRRIHAVDRDNFDEVFARLQVAVRLPSVGDAAPLELGFRELEALNPDQLYERVEVFAELRKLRRRLENASTFAAAAAELGAAPLRPAPPPPVRSAPAPAPAFDLLSAALDATESGPAQRSNTKSELVDAMLRELVIPHVTPAPDPRRAELVAAVDAGTSAHMRALLHHPHLRAIEAAWRGLEMLVRRLETDTDLSIHVLDVTRAELDADLHAADTVTRSALWKRLVEATVATPGGEPWSLLLGLSTFDATLEDAQLLTSLAALAAGAGAPFVAAAHPRLAGCESLAMDTDPDDWTWSMPASAGRAFDELRASENAAFVGLTLPRLLLRLPFGAKAGTVESFAFEELANAQDHEGYLWGSGAFAVGLHLGSEFRRVGSDLQPDTTIAIEDLPADVRERDGEPTLMPCAESLLTDRAVERASRHGLTVLRSIRGRDAVQVGPLRGFSGGLLAGPWN